MSLWITSNLEGVATLPCEILVFKICTDRKHSNGRPAVHIEGNVTTIGELVLRQ